MATRNLEAIEHKGTVYVSLDDLQKYVASLVEKTGNARAPDALLEMQYQLATIHERRA